MTGIDGMYSIPRKCTTAFQYYPIQNQQPSQRVTPVRTLFKPAAAEEEEEEEEEGDEGDEEEEGDEEGEDPG